MPTLDVSEAMDPSFMDTFIICRKSQVVTERGDAEHIEKQLNGTGVVTAASPNDMLRVPESAYMQKAISIVTQVKMQGPTPGYSADEVIWGGERFVVQTVGDYSHFGRGFIQVVATAIEPVGPPPQLPDPVGRPIGRA